MSAPISEPLVPAFGAERWERERMTICIAASCMDGNDHKIIMCSDWLTSTPAIGQANTMLKQRRLSERIYCLTSGGVDEILTTMPILRRTIGTAAQIDETTILSLVRQALTERKRDKANEFTSGKYAMSYDDFLKMGKDHLPPDLFREAMYRISTITIDAEYAVAGFDDARMPFLIETNTFCEAYLREGFAVVGSGSVMAKASLLQRSYSEVRDSNESVFAIYEAKKSAERVSTVGKTTTITILEADGRIGFMLAPGLKYLDSIYDSVKPKPIPDVKLEEKFFKRSASGDL